MKSKKLFLPAIILAAAIVAIAVCTVVLSIAFKPTVTEHEFPISITYEYKGETKTINDVYTAYYTGNGGLADTKTRLYSGKLTGKEENDTIYIIQDDENGKIELITNLHADYYMGDIEELYYTDTNFEPEIYYYDEENCAYNDEETLSKMQVKLIDFKYPEPIDNGIVYSHMSNLSSDIVFPILLIALLALLATVIFVKKDENYIKKPFDVVSTIFNFIIGIATIPFFSVSTWLIDALGDNDGFLGQSFYFTPAISALCIAASIALRRKGYSKLGFFVQFIGPAFFAVILFLSEIL